jgi:polyether ionophore transport system ATP-binding protein
VTFEAAAPDLGGVAGVHVVGAGANAIRAEVTGSMAPLIDALAGHPVVAIESREPSLEEIFLHHYDESDGRVAA